MKIYTKTGDKGLTGLLSGQRVPKDHVRVETYGTLDEATSLLGLAKSFLLSQNLKDIIDSIQRELLLVNADLATEGNEKTKYRISEIHIRNLEQLIDNIEAKRIPQKGFIIPGSCTAGAVLDVARTVVRRAERWVVKLQRSQYINSSVLLYLNRLSDLLFVFARFVEQEELVRLITIRVLKGLNGQQKSGFSIADRLTAANAIIQAAQQKAIKIGVPMVIAVVDEGGHLVALNRMDGALLCSLSLARDKAYTAVALKTATDQLAKLTQPGESLYGLSSTNGGRLVTFGGGFPLFREGKVVGGIGVSGGTVAEDMMVAKAGLNLWQECEQLQGGELI